MRHAVLLVFSLAIAVIVYLQLTSTNDVQAAPRYEVSVWYPGWGNAGISDYDSLSTNASSVGRVMPYWYALNADGSVSPYEWAEDSKLVSLARDKGIRLMPLVSNEFDPARANKMLSSQASRDAHAAELTKLTVSKGYDGLDLDYESMYAADRDNFSLFVEDLASRLHAEDKKLSVVVHPKTSEPGNWDGPKAQDWRRISQAADEFEIMIYDYHWNGSEAGPAAPQEWIESVLTFAEKEVDPAKIRMGLPFYGRDWMGTKAKDLVYDDVQALLSQHNTTVQRDPSGEPYFTYRDAGNSDHTVYFQDSKSLAAKLDVLALKHPNVGGISVWHIGGESPEHWTTVKNKLGQPAPAPPSSAPAPASPPSAALPNSPSASPALVDKGKEDKKKKKKKKNGQGNKRGK